jgi:hypothetical protein
VGDTVGPSLACPGSRKRWQERVGRINPDERPLSNARTLVERCVNTMTPQACSIHRRFPKNFSGARCTYEACITDQPGIEPLVKHLKGDWMIMLQIEVSIRLLEAIIESTVEALRRSAQQILMDFGGLGSRAGADVDGGDLAALFCCADGEGGVDCFDGGGRGEGSA